MFDFLEIWAFRFCVLFPVFEQIMVRLKIQFAEVEIEVPVIRVDISLDEFFLRDNINQKVESLSFKSKELKQETGHMIPHSE